MTTRGTKAAQDAHWRREQAQDTTAAQRCRQQQTTKGGKG